MKAQTRKAIVAAALLSTLAAGCGDVARNGRAPVMAVVVRLEGAAGVTPAEFGGTLSSDVVTNVKRTVNGQQVDVPTIFADIGRVTIQLTLRDPGIPGAAAAPSALNEVTFTRYRVVYRRADGLNTPGVDVPYAFDSGLTFTVPADGTATAGFELVRSTAKMEAPLVALARSSVAINTIAEVTFYGKDQAGNDVSATGSIGITFANWGDPS